MQGLLLEFTGSLLTIDRGFFTLSGITFSSNSTYAQIYLDNVQEVMIQACNFRGVGIYMYSVDSTKILRRTFSDYYYINYFGALYISYSSAVSVVQSNFTSNIYYRGNMGI